MKNKIHVLSDETINQIAAGEVIESPSSVVKELVENALDADAKRVTVEVAAGGMKSIRVSDDGVGMNREDARMSIVRHATSKIEKPQDLFRIITKGFRGEAIASIASISKMTLITAENDLSGTKLEIEKGEIIRESPIARTHGTTIEVRSLFYNVPARKKFQKSPAAISAEIFRMMTVMALSHPDVHFQLISNGRKAIQTQTIGLEERAKELIGEEFCSGSFPLQFEEQTLHFTGLIGSPTNHRNNRMGQYLFLNKRAVGCDAIAEAVREGYGTRLEEKRHPIFLLHLDVPSDLVDVNVHPQKLEVRLRKEELFREKVKEAVEKALSKRTSIAPRVVGTFAQSEARALEEVSLRFQEEPILQEIFVLDESPIEVMGQLGCFLFVKEETKIIVIDLQAAQYRIRFEDLLAKADKGIEKQGLLVPFSINVTAVESAMILTHQDAIEKLGFSLRAIGKDIFMIEAIPSFIREDDVKTILSNMAESLQSFIGKIDYEKERQKKLALIAARFAHTKNEYFPEEAKGLYKKLQKCESPLQSPKGNPTMVELAHDTIENLFAADKKAAKGSAK